MFVLLDASPWSRPFNLVATTHHARVKPFFVTPYLLDTMLLSLSAILDIKHLIGGTMYSTIQLRDAILIGLFYILAIATC